MKTKAITSTEEYKTIRFPLLYGCDRLVPVTFKIFKKHELAYVKEGCVVLRQGSSETIWPRWIIGSDGIVFTVEVVRVVTRWPSLRWWYDYSLRECRLIPQGVLTVSEVLGLTSQCKDSFGVPFKRYLKGYLKKLDPASPFDAVEFKKFYDQHCAAVPKGEWGREIKF